MINIEPTISPPLSIQKMLRYVEWIIVVVYIFYYFLSTANGTLNLVEGKIGLLIAFLITITVCSWVFPDHRSSWIKYAYISLGISFTLFVTYYGLGVDAFIYLYISKSWFLLRRKPAVMLTAIVGCLYVAVVIGSLPEFIPTVFVYAADSINPRDPKVIWDFALSTLFNYTICSTFVILFCSTIHAEKRNRQRAEELSWQVESLAAQLERVRIARDIHDSFGHTLTNLQVQLALAQEFSQHKPERAFKAVDMAKFLADQCVEDMSLTLKAMHRADFKLNQALQSLMEKFKSNQHLKVRSEINLPQLPLQVSYHLYYIIQEGLTNIQKHAQAAQIYLQCQAITDSITVRLEDDGQGFDSTLSYPGFGLRGMKERVQLLNGELKIHSALGAGTQIQAIIPFR